MGLTMTTIGKRLRDARNRVGLTQRQVAAVLGISESTISYWESGQRGLDLSSLSRLCEIYGYSVSSMLEDSPNSNPAISVALRAKNVAESDLQVISWAKRIAMSLDQLYAFREEPEFGQARR